MSVSLKQEKIDSGAWAFESDYDVSTPAGEAVVQAENNQDLVEVAEETAISNTGLNPVDQEILKGEFGTSIGRTGSTSDQPW